jgi:hypothetical protein
MTSETPVDEPSNPFDPEGLRADPGDDDIVTKRIVHHMKVRKPYRHEFLRVNPDPAFCTDVYLIEAGDGVEKDAFIVTPALAREILAETCPAPPHRQRPCLLENHARLRAEPGQA